MPFLNSPGNNSNNEDETKEGKIQTGLENFKP